MRIKTLHQACLAKHGLTAPVASDIKRYTRLVTATRPLGASVGPGDRGLGLQFQILQEGGNAHAAGICEGDLCISINGMLVKGMQHGAAVDTLKSASTPLTMLVSSLVEDPIALRPPTVVSGTATSSGASSASASALGDGHSVGEIAAAASESSTATASAPGASTAAAPPAHSRTVVLRRGPAGYGMAVGPATDDGMGIMIAEIVPGGAAAQCGEVCDGDVILAINGERVDGLGHAAACEKMAGTTELVLEIALRASAPSVQHEASPPSTEETSGRVQHDIVVDLKGLHSRRALGIEVGAASVDGERGLCVIRVATGGPADIGGMAVGDHIIAIGGRDVANAPTEDAVKILTDSTDSNTSSYTISRSTRVWAV